MKTLWTPTLLTLSSALDDDIRLVGGCVRDMLLGIPPSDIDIATPLPPDTVRHLLSKSGIRSYPIAPAHGVIGAHIDHTNFEITTLRREVFDTRFHEKITFITDYAEDSNRRDFTINALYLDTHHTVYDYHNGQNDLHNHIVRFIGHPEQRLAEDPLRLLRYFRFWGIYGTDTPDPDILSLIPKIAPLLPRVSPFRRHKELLRLIASPALMKVLPLLRSYHLFPLILSQFSEKKLDLPPDFMAYLNRKDDLS